MKSRNHFSNFLVLALLAALILPSQLCLAAGGICVYPLGDINQDKIVDWTDLGLMADQWLQSSGSADLDNSGNIDLIDYALLAADWEATGNCSPVVDAGIDQEITLPADANLAIASVTDDGLPNPPAAVTTLWTKESGPNDVTFGNASTIGTTASFAGPGVYVLRLTANDGDMTTFDELTVTVNPPAVANTAPVVNAGNDVTITYPTLDVSLDGTVTDDGLPNPPGAVTTLWSVTSGPAGVTFDDANAVDTVAHFPAAGGTFVLRIDANDGELTAYDEVTVTVNGAPQWSETANYYVDGLIGDDLNAGTSDAPFKTITKGLSSGGSKVLVWGRGQVYTYTEALTMPGSITLKRDPASLEAVINGGGSNVISSSAGHWTINGFKLTGGGSGVYLLNANAHFVTITNCRITGNTATYAGVYLQRAPNNTIYNNAIYANSGAGIFATGSVSSPGTANIVTQNTVYGNSGNAVWVNVGPASITDLRDCIISGNGGSAIRNGTSSCTLSPITYCDVVGGLSNVTLGTGCHTGDPKLHDPANGDFHLDAGTAATPASGGGGTYMGYIYSSSAL